MRRNAVPVVGVVPVAICLGVSLVATLLVEHGLELVARTDWGLIVTFAAFFVFSGNLARIEAVQTAFAGWLAGGAFVPAALFSQIISNVPAAVVLSRFTGDWAGLLAGVNVGGAGTPIASLATLIVITQFGLLARELGAGAPRDSRSCGVADAAAQTGFADVDAANRGAARNRETDSVGTIGAPASGRSLPATRHFMVLLCGLNAACLAVLLAAGITLGW